MYYGEEYDKLSYRDQAQYRIFKFGWDIEDPYDSRNWDMQEPTSKQTIMPSSSSEPNTPWENFLIGTACLAVFFVAANYYAPNLLEPSQAAKNNIVGRANPSQRPTHQDYARAALGAASTSSVPTPEAGSYYRVKATTLLVVVGSKDYDIHPGAYIRCTRVERNHISVEVPFQGRPVTGRIMEGEYQNLEWSSEKNMLDDVKRQKANGGRLQSKIEPAPAVTRSMLAQKERGESPYSLQSVPT